MNRLTFFWTFLLMNIACIGQDLEFCGSLSTSSEQRFQSAFGVGFQYQHDLNSKFKIGFGMHHNFKKSYFDEVPEIDIVSTRPSVKRISSESQRFSLRLNIQRLIKNNENVSVSIGPEISYNYLWGKDYINSFMEWDTQWNSYSQKNKTTRMLGIGVISKIEIKNFITSKFSLCFTIRPEFIINGVFAKGGEQVFSSGLSFTEFQLGLKYRFK